MRLRPLWQAVGYACVLTLFGFGILLAIGIYHNRQVKSPVLFGAEHTLPASHLYIYTDTPTLALKQTLTRYGARGAQIIYWQDNPDVADLVLTQEHGLWQAAPSTHPQATDVMRFLSSSVAQDHLDPKQQEDDFFLEDKVSYLNDIVFE